MLYSPPSGLTVTGVRLVSVLQCSCIQLLPGAAHSSTLNTETSVESTHTLAQMGLGQQILDICSPRYKSYMSLLATMKQRMMITCIESTTKYKIFNCEPADGPFAYLPLPFASSFRCIFLVVFIIQVIQVVVWLKDSLS